MRISAWRLAKLNKAEATLAAASARKASSILRPVPPPDLEVLNESDESYTSNGSRSHSIASTEFGTPQFPLQKNGDDGRSSMSLSPYKSELPRIRTGREPEVIGAWSKSLGMDLKSSGSSSSRSSFFGRHLVDAASKFSASSVSSASQQPELARKSSAIPVDPSGSRVNKAFAHPKIARAMGATLSDGYDASAGETTDDMRRSGKGRMMFIRDDSKLSPAGSTSGPSFDTRAANQFRGVSTASRTIQFRGRGISTSVLSAYQSRPSRRPPSSSFSSESDAELGHPDQSTTGNLGIVSSSQRFPSRQTVGNSQVHGPSIFFSSPLMPIGEATSRRPPPPTIRNQLPLGRPPVPNLRSGTIPGNPQGPVSSSRTNNPRVIMLPPSHSLDPSDR